LHTGVKPFLVIFFVTGFSSRFNGQSSSETAGPPSASRDQMGWLEGEFFQCADGSTALQTAHGPQKIPDRSGGCRALYSDTTGFIKTATGLSALSDNTTGFLNTATGYQAFKGNL